MNKEIEKEVLTEEYAEDMTLTALEEKDTFFKKAGRFIKKHGKAIAIGTSLVGGVLVGAALSRSKEKSSEDCEYYGTEETLETTFDGDSEVTSKEE